MKRIVALCGMKGSGKDTIGSVLINAGYQRIQIAEPLKDGIKSMFNLSDEHVNGDLKETEIMTGITPRFLLQYIGTDIMHPLMGKDVWIKQAVEKIKTLSMNHDNFVITDMRFVYESEYLRKHFPSSFIVFIERDLVEKSEHVSECECHKIISDLVIDNTGNLNDLFSQVKNKILSI